MTEPTTKFHRAVRRLVIHTDDGERSISWLGDLQATPAELVEQIEDVLHWPAGYHSGFQQADDGPATPLDANVWTILRSEEER